MGDAHRPAGSDRGRIEVAFGLMALATFLFPLGDTISKILTRSVTPLEISFWRLLFQTVALALLARALPRRRQGSLLSPLLAGGGLALATTSVCLVTAFAVMPIATAIVIFFVEPLILTLLSGVFLGERAGWRRYLAIAIGLLGAVVVIRPNWSTFGLYSILPLGAAVAFASNMVLIRLASRTHSTLTIQCGMSLFGALALGAAALAATALGFVRWSGFGAPAHVWPLYLILGLLAGATVLSLSEAFRRAPASTLAPLQYLEIIGATLFGYLVFGDFPDLWTWIGTAIILLSGLYVLHRERVQARDHRGM